VFYKSEKKGRSRWSVLIPKTGKNTPQRRQERKRIDMSIVYIYIYISPFPTSFGHCRKLSYLKEGKKERHPSATAKKSKQVVAVKCRKSKQDDLKTNQRKAHLSASKPIYIQQDKVFRSVYLVYIYIYIIPCLAAEAVAGERERASKAG
jgi:hypothetical protein